MKDPPDGVAIVSLEERLTLLHESVLSPLNIERGVKERFDVCNCDLTGRDHHRSIGSGHPHAATDRSVRGTIRFRGFMPRSHHICCRARSGTIVLQCYSTCLHPDDGQGSFVSSSPQ
jgi:hypothetical protein